MASQFGQARRALLLDDVLLGVSDYSVESFDISDRSAPRRLDGVELARNVGALRRVGAAVLRFWPDSVAVNVLGMVAAWLLSLAAGALLQRWLEPPVQARAAA